MHWMWHTFGLVCIWFVIVGALCVYCFAWDFIGIVVRILLFLIPPLRFDHTKKGFAFHLHEQSDSLGFPWGFGFNAWGRKFFFFHYYMGWSNSSEGHHRDKCTDHAYCQWHGSL